MLIKSSRGPNPLLFDALVGRGHASSSSGSAPMDLSITSRGGTLDSNLMPDAPHCTPSKIKDLGRSRWGERDSYDEIQHVGSGSYGSCVLLKRRSDSALRVCKVTERVPVHDDKGAFEAEPLEAKILKDILPPHHRICRLHESIIQPRTVQLYFDYYSGGDLSDLIRLYEWNWELMPETFLWHAFMQLAEALAFMHTGYNRGSLCSPPDKWRSVYHGDIKPGNIFLSPPDPNSKDPLCRLYPSLVLGDFGMSSVGPSAGYGTLKYQPPEMPAVSGPADVWALGCVLHSMAHYDAPVAPLPDGIPSTQANLVRWLTFYPEARALLPLYDAYSTELHDSVFEAFEWDPRGRISGLELYRKVLDVYTCRISPYIPNMLEPLIGTTYQGKLYDENGVTLNTVDARSVNANIVQDPEDVKLDEALGKLKHCERTEPDASGSEDGSTEMESTGSYISCKAAAVMSIDEDVRSQFLDAREEVRELLTKNRQLRVFRREF